MPRLSTRRLCVARPGNVCMWVLRPPSAYSLTSVWMERPLHSLNPALAKPGRSTSKRKTRSGSDRPPVSAIAGPQLDELGRPLPDRDADGDALGRPWRANGDLADHFARLRALRRIGRLVAEHGV